MIARPLIAVLLPLLLLGCEPGSQAESKSAEAKRVAAEVTNTASEELRLGRAQVVAVAALRAAHRAMARDQRGRHARAS